MNKLFVDCKTDQEKYDFFLSGRAHETGVIAASLQADVAMAYQRCVGFQDELRRLNEVNVELVEALKCLTNQIFDQEIIIEWDDKQKALAALAKAEVTK